MHAVDTIAAMVIGCFCIGTVLGIAWVAWVYGTDLPSHSETTEEEEERMLESLREGRGLRASEMGENCE